MSMVHKLICSSCNEMVDVTAVFIRKYARDTHLYQVVSTGNYNWQATENTNLNYYHGQGQEITHVSTAWQ